MHTLRLTLSKREIWLSLCLIFLALGGIIGGILMLIQPDGSLLGLSPDLLRSAPVHTYVWPGIFLVSAMGLWPSLNLCGLLQHRQWVQLSNRILGATTLVWVVYEVMTIHSLSPLQPLIGLIGIVLLLHSTRRT